METNSSYPIICAVRPDICDCQAASRRARGSALARFPTSARLGGGMVSRGCGHAKRWESDRDHIIIAQPPQRVVDWRAGGAWRTARMAAIVGKKTTWSPDNGFALPASPQRPSTKSSQAPLELTCRRVSKKTDPGFQGALDEGTAGGFVQHPVRHLCRIGMVPGDARNLEPRCQAAVFHRMCFQKIMGVLSRNRGFRRGNRGTFGLLGHCSP